MLQFGPVVFTEISTSGPIRASCYFRSIPRMVLLQVFVHAESTRLVVMENLPSLRSESHGRR